MRVFFFFFFFFFLIIIIIAVISIAPYLTDKGEHTMLYKINKNIYMLH